MLGTSLDLATLAIVVAAALIAGFTTGFAGFGTGLVASGLWFHALPAPMVPPLVALASVAGQLVGVVTVRKSFDWPRLIPFLIGGVIGIPLGVGALKAVSPFLLRTSVGAFLIIYSLYQLSGRRPREIGAWGGRLADGVVGIVGGFLGGFAGLSAPPPVVWLQLRGGDSADQRAIYQPFNLIVLTFASAAMAAGGEIGAPLVSIAFVCLPATMIGAWIGARAYFGVSPQTFQRVVLCLLVASGCILLAQAFGI
ncbi:MAG TPA: sulfite exporter TauE/SafE family protein [Xanthobacteraceae bacterium]|jgi:hypothetical protein